MFTCKVTDVYGEESSDDVTVSTFEPNVVATPELSYSDNLTSDHETGVVMVTLDGCDTEDIDNDDLTYNFVQFDGDEEVELSNSSVCSVDVSLEAGEYTFGLRVRDEYMVDSDGDDVYTEFVTVSFDVNFDNTAPQVAINDAPESLEIPHNCDGTDYINYVLSGQAVDPDEDAIYSHLWEDNGVEVCYASVCNLTFDAGLIENLCSVGILNLFV